LRDALPMPFYPLANTDGPPPKQERSVIDLKETFERLNDQYLQFNQIDIEDRPFSRPDLCAFARIDHLITSEEWSNIVSTAEHNRIYLDVDCDGLAEVATEDDVLYLVRCGVTYDMYFKRLTMFV
jgi:hypothetical protein